MAKNGAPRTDSENESLETRERTLQVPEENVQCDEKIDHGHHERLVEEGLVGLGGQVEDKNTEKRPGSQTFNPTRIRQTHSLILNLTNCQIVNWTECNLKIS